MTQWLSLTKEMGDQTVEGPSSVKWSALCAGKQLRFLHVMGIWLDFFSWVWFQVSSCSAQREGLGVCLHPGMQEVGARWGSRGEGGGGRRHGIAELSPDVWSEPSAWEARFY